jgi:hypothetical protein
MWDLRYLEDRVREVVLFEHCRVPDTIGFEDSLSQRVSSLADGRETELLQAYFDGTQLGSDLVLVHLVASPELLVSRIQARKDSKVILKHTGLSAEQLQSLCKQEVMALEVLVQQAKEHGVTVVAVDASLSPGQIVEQIETYISSTGDLSHKTK